MYLHFHPTEGMPFFLEIDNLDTVLEIKKKIQKDQGIPVYKQSLYFNRRVLADELNVQDSNIRDWSHITIIVAFHLDDLDSMPTPPTTPHHNIVEADHDEFSILPSKKIQLLLRMPTQKPNIALEMDVDDSIRRLKEKIHEMEGLPASTLIIRAGGVELHDGQILHDCKLLDHSEIEVSIRLSSSTISAGPSRHTRGSKKLKIMVLTMDETKKIPVEVNPWDNVGQLREELEKLKGPLDLNLSEEGYFFIHKQSVMDDDRSFRWHRVGQGDTIEIFNGTVTSG